MDLKEVVIDKIKELYPDIRVIYLTEMPFCHCEVGNYKSFQNISLDELFFLRVFQPHSDNFYVVIDIVDKEIYMFQPYLPIIGTASSWKKYFSHRIKKEFRIPFDEQILRDNTE